jgi:hypothetical protein
MFMSTFPVCVDSAVSAGNGNREDSPRVDSRARFGSTRPIAPVCERIWRDWLRGVSERTLSAMYRLTRPIVEDVLREQARQLARGVCRGAGATACLLIGLAVSWVWPGGRPAEVRPAARAFRVSRRRAGLEDGAGPTVEHARVEVRTLGTQVCSTPLGSGLDERAALCGAGAARFFAGAYTV